MVPAPHGRQKRHSPAAEGGRVPRISRLVARRMNLGPLEKSEFDELLGAAEAAFKKHPFDLKKAKENSPAGRIERKKMLLNERIAAFNFLLVAIRKMNLPEPGKTRLVPLAEKIAGRHVLGPVKWHGAIEIGEDVLRSARESGHIQDFFQAVTELSNISREDFFGLRFADANDPAVHSLCNGSVGAFLLVIAIERKISG